MIRVLTSLNCRAGKLSVDSENHSLGTIWCQRYIHDVQCVLFVFAVSNHVSEAECRSIPKPSSL